MTLERIEILAMLWMYNIDLCRRASSMNYIGSGCKGTYPRTMSEDPSYHLKYGISINPRSVDALCSR